MKNNSENSKPYGVFVYVFNTDGEPPVRYDYFTTRKAAVNKAVKLLIELTKSLHEYKIKKSFYKTWMIEVWKRDKEGLFGNCGLPEWCTRNSGFFDACINRKDKH